MNLLTAENISKTYGEKILLDNINFSISEGEKIGLIGVNGSGKSTFLKILSEIEPCDTGKVTTINNIKIEYLPQNPYFDNTATVIMQVFKSASPVMKLIEKYELTTEELNQNPDDINLQKQIISLNSEMDAMNAWNIESEAKNILTKLGVSNFSCLVGTLSGGQKKRIALASALINETDLLILDEPTNHIDSDTVEWLEKYLNNRKGALIMITHDRYFLDRFANKIIELNNGNLYSYAGNYSVFLQLKAEREDINIASESKRQSLLKKELAWIRRGAKARTTKQKARIDRFEKLKDDEIDVSTDKMNISSASSRLGKKVIDIENISKSFSENNVITNFSYILIRNDRIGIIGPNGSGKSTLVNILSGVMQPDTGIVSIGETVKIGYYHQENIYLNENLRVIDYIKEEGEFVRTSDNALISASQMLERFLFSPHMQYTPISKLSGGEKRRLYLLRVLMSAPNVLLLDEPTNDLDIETLTILEDYLEGFNGAIIVVSHDRYFLDKTVSKILSFEKDGSITQYTGNYSDYQEYIQEKNDKAEIIIKEKSKSAKNVTKETTKRKPLKFTFKQQKDYNEIDGKIEDIENKIKDVDSRINSTGSDYELLQVFILEKKDLEKTLNELIEQWTFLSDLAEEIKKNNI